MIDSENNNPSVNIYILNSGIGESIVINVHPLDFWGVIDCFTFDIDSPHKNPTLNLLKYKKVEKLNFISLTHPHYDHYYGLSHILDHYRNLENFWLYHTYSYAKEIASFCEQFEPKGRFKELLKILKDVSDRRNKKTLKIKYFSDLKPLYNQNFKVHERADVMCLKIFGIGPTSNVLDKFKETLSNYIKVEDNGSVYIDNDKRSPDLNLLCGCILIMFGNTKILLGSDVVLDSWKDILNMNSEFAQVGINLSSDIVKISHHGSKTGYCTGLWNTISKNKKPIGVLTPYTKYKLPDKEALDEISPHVEFFKTTSLKDTFNDSTRRRIKLPSEYSIEEIDGLSNYFTEIIEYDNKDTGIVHLEYDTWGNLINTECHDGAGKFSYQNQA